jgi:hypothetical protein
METTYLTSGLSARLECKWVNDQSVFGETGAGNVMIRARRGLTFKVATGKAWQDREALGKERGVSNPRLVHSAVIDSRRRFLSTLYLAAPPLH